MISESGGSNSTETSELKGSLQSLGGSSSD
jgi:hypothetical protein